MRICHIGNPNSVAVKVFVEHFSRTGHEVHTFGWGPYRFERNPNIIHHNLSFRDSEEERTEGIRTLGGPAGEGKGHTETKLRPIADLYEFLRLRTLISRLRPDIVHGHEASGNGFTTGSIRRIPTILTCWGSDINKFPWESRISHFKVNYALHHVDRIHVTDGSFAQTIVDRFGVPQDRIANITWGIDTDLFSPENIDHKRLASFKLELGIGKDDIVITYPAGFRDESFQNYVNLVKAFADLSKKNGDLKLIMLSYTRRSGYDRIKRILDENDLWDRVRIVDQYLPQEDMPYLFASTDIMTLLHDVDQMSASISESMLMGCHVLLSGIDPYRRNFKDGEVVFTDQKDPRDIGKKLQYMMDNSSELERFSVERNRRNVREHNSRKVQIKKIEEMYESLLV